MKRQFLIIRHILCRLGALAAIAFAVSPYMDGAEPTPKPDLVFLLAGQSNMVGHGRSEQLLDEYAKSPPRVLLYEAGEFRSLPSSQLQQRRRGHFGPELSFGHELAKAFPDRTILLVKHAVGGTNLSRNWNPKVRGSLYGKLLIDYRAAVQGRSIELGGVLWSQGGADAKLENSAQAYAENIKALIESFRKDLGAVDLPFYIGGARPEDPVSADAQSKFPYLKLVRAAYVKTEGEVPHTFLVSTVGLQLGADGIHYDTAGQLEFGKRFARAYLENYADFEKSR